MFTVATLILLGILSGVYFYLDSKYKKSISTLIDTGIDKEYRKFRTPRRKKITKSKYSKRFI